MTGTELKNLGNKEFSNERFLKSISLYSRGLARASSDERDLIGILYGNRC